ncbi:MAG TPA: hypothetical protein VGE29_21050 [Prosthecobacter sp.]
MKWVIFFLGFCSFLLTASAESPTVLKTSELEVLVNHILRLKSFDGPYCVVEDILNRGKGSWELVDASFLQTAKIKTNGFSRVYPQDLKLDKESTRFLNRDSRHCQVVAINGVQSRKYDEIWGTMAHWWLFIDYEDQLFGTVWVGKNSEGALTVKMLSRAVSFEAVK